MRYETIHERRGHHALFALAAGMMLFHLARERRRALCQQYGPEFEGRLGHPHPGFARRHPGFARHLRAHGCFGPEEATAPEVPGKEPGLPQGETSEA